MEPFPTLFSEDVLARIRSIGSANILVGIPSYRNALTTPHVVRAVTGFKFAKSGWHPKNF